MFKSSNLVSSFMAEKKLGKPLLHLLLLKENFFYDFNNSLKTWTTSMTKLSIFFPFTSSRGKRKKQRQWKLISRKTIKLKEIKLNSETNVSLIFDFVVYSNTFQIDWFNFQLMYINYWLFVLLISINSDHYNLDFWFLLLWKI